MQGQEQRGREMLLDQAQYNILTNLQIWGVPPPQKSSVLGLKISVAVPGHMHYF